MSGDMPQPTTAGTAGNGSEPALSGPALALAQSHVDLIKMIDEGLPEPSHVPGCAPWLLAGKRYLCPAAAGDGKTLTWLVIAMSVIEAGGKVVILDVENGGEEYARRLADVLDARDEDGELASACRGQLRYFAWPRLSLGWDADEWAAAIDGADLVIFDSSRMALTSVGLAEDKADDYSKFVGSLLLPLAQAGSTTVVLDNTGHDEGQRARGTSAKADLNEVVYRLAVLKPFDRDQTGEIALVRGRHRFPGLPREIRIELGDGVYGPPTIATGQVNQEDKADFRPTFLMQKTSEAIERQPGVTTVDLRNYVKGKTDWKNKAVRILIDEGYVRTEPDGKEVHHYSVVPFHEGDE